MKAAYLFKYVLPINGHQTLKGLVSIYQAGIYRLKVANNGTRTTAMASALNLFHTLF